MSLAEDLAIPVEYQGRQIQIAAWLDKPPGAGPFPSLSCCTGAAR
jgi:hypothetical protein